ncbi:MAG: SRPBCC domain-containing protein [Thermomicrobiales bacterium]
MENLRFSISINAPRQHVWDTMLGADTYLTWSAAAWPGSSFTGDWSEGSEMRFGGEGGGTAARITESRPPERLSAEHFAVISADGTLDRDSDMAKSWIGSTETYTFDEHNGATEIVVDLTVPFDWVSEFEESWPKGLQALRELAESRTA